MKYKSRQRKMAGRTTNIQKARKAAAYIWFALFIVCCTVLALGNTVLFGDYFSSVLFFYRLSFIRDALMIIASVCIVLSFVDERTRDARVAIFKLIFKIVLVVIIYFIAYMPVNINDSISIWLLILFAITADYWEEDKILKTAFFIGTAVIVIFFFLSMIGFVENNRGNSFGFTFRTHYCCFLVFMVMAYAVVKDGWFTWVGELGLIAMEVYIIWLGGKTAAICLAFLIIGVMWRHYTRNGGCPFQSRTRFGNLIPHVFRVLYLPVVAIDYAARRISIFKLKCSGRKLMKYSFIICGAFTFVSVFTYWIFPSLWKLIPGFFSYKARLFLGLIGFEEFPIRLFGSHIPLIGLSGSEAFQPLYFAFDSAYVKILLQAGLIPFMVIFGLLTYTQFRLYKRKRYFAMFAITLLAIDCIMEYWIADLSYNPFILLSSCVLSEKPGVEVCDRLEIGRLTLQKKMAIRLCTLAVLIIFACWSFTAYKITGWRGWTPDYGATLAVTGSSEQHLITAASYLNTHEDAVCIVSSEEDRQRLVDQNIDDSRILVSERIGIDDIDGMLESTCALIKIENLPPRLTICAPKMQQERISQHARDLHIPVNSVAFRLRGMNHIKMFTSEQWRLLCGE